MNITAQTLQIFDPAMCCSTGVCGPEVDTKLVQNSVTEKGEAALPVILVNGKVASTGRYPAGSELALWFKLKAKSPSAPTQSSCCGGGTC